MEDRVDEMASDEEVLKPQIKSHPHTSWGRHNAKVEMKKRLDPELKTRDQLFKQRMKKQKLQAREVSSKMKNDAKRKRAASKKASKGKGKK